MSNLVPSDSIESIVGAPRHNSHHRARAVREEQTVYVLHSGSCVRNFDDLRKCPFSVALDQGIDLEAWAAFQDEPVQVVVREGRLVPVGRVSE